MSWPIAIFRLKVHEGFEESCQDRSEAQMHIFSVLMPVYARTKQIAAYSEIFRRVKMGGMRRIIDKIMLIRANLLELCRSLGRECPRMHLPNSDIEGYYEKPKDS